MSIEQFLLDVDAHHIIVRRMITSENDKDFLENIVDEEVGGLYGETIYPNMKILSITEFKCSDCPKILSQGMYVMDVLYDIVIMPEKGNSLEDVINPFLQDILAEDLIEGRGFKTETFIYMPGNSIYDGGYEMDRLKEKCRKLIKK